MANREALRELQSRLASRLQAARAEGVQAGWLAVEAAGRKYLFPLSQAGEIFPFTATQPVPYTHDWFLGVANLRGDYWNEAWSQEKNEQIFGRCARRNGHGHNYTLEVTVKGDVDPRSGFVVDLKDLKEILNREVLDAFDHRFLNKEVPDFRATIPTTENLAIAVWRRLAEKLRVAQLHRVRVYETPDLFVDYYGE